MCAPTCAPSQGENSLYGDVVLLQLPQTFRMFHKILKALEWGLANCPVRGLQGGCSAKWAGEQRELKGRQPCLYEAWGGVERDQFNHYNNVSTLLAPSQDCTHFVKVRPLGSTARAATKR
jgi:hypothetical protein